MSTGRFRTNAVEQLGSRNERDAEARKGQNHPIISWIAGHVMHPAFNCSERDRISHEIGLKTRLDDKQPADLLQSCHWLSQRHANDVVPPFPD